MPLTGGRSMLRTLLICGLVAGLFAGLTGFGFARLTGEGPIEAAIAFEDTQLSAHEHDGGHTHGAQAETSRATQKGVGLLTATTVAGLALGGIFALVFAMVYGRIGSASPGSTAVWLPGSRSSSCSSSRS